MRHTHLTTQQAIDILIREGAIYWTAEGYSSDGVDWLMVSIFFNTQEIHTFGQGMKTKVINEDYRSICIPNPLLPHLPK